MANTSRLHAASADRLPAGSSTSGGVRERIDSFAPLLDYDNRLYNVAFRILRDRDDALDALQDAYTQAYRGFHRFRGDSHPYTWLYRIMLNECARRGGKRTTRRKREAELPVMEEWGLQFPTEDSAFPLIDLERAARTIRDAVHALPAIYREVVNLRYFGQMSYQEVADASACPVGTVRSRLARAHERLKQRLPSTLLGEVASASGQS